MPKYRYIVPKVPRTQILLELQHVSTVLMPLKVSRNNAVLLPVQEAAITQNSCL